MKVATKRLLEEQIAAIVVPGRGEKSDAMWHVPQRGVAYVYLPASKLSYNCVTIFRTAFSVDVLEIQTGNCE